MESNRCLGEFFVLFDYFYYLLAERVVYSGTWKVQPKEKQRIVWIL
jgi:hypothetical protein